MTVVEQITEALSVIPEVIGCAVLRPDRVPEPGWRVFPLPDGRRVRVDFAGEPSAEITESVRAALAAINPQPLTPQEEGRRRARRLARSADPQAVLLRAALRVAFQAIKECRDQLGLPSRTWAQLQAAVEQQIDSGGGDN